MDATNTETIRAINRAFEAGQLDDFLRHCTPDVRWTMMGTGTWVGTDAIRAEWNCMAGAGTAGLPRIAVDQIFADEADGVADGIVITPRADGSEMRMHYCDVYRFRDGLVAELKSYCIEQKPAPEPA